MCVNRGYYLYEPTLYPGRTRHSWEFLYFSRWCTKLFRIFAVPVLGADTCIVCYYTLDSHPVLLQWWFYPVNTRRWINAVSMLGQRRRSISSFHFFLLYNFPKNILIFYNCLQIIFICEYILVHYNGLHFRVPSIMVFGVFSSTIYLRTHSP